jgi:hypothetical protein
MAIQNDEDRVRKLSNAIGKLGQLNKKIDAITGLRYKVCLIMYVILKIGVNVLE